MPKCQRPLVTALLVVCWLVVFLGTLLTHAALGTLVPAIEDLPDNLIKGFGEVFKFDKLEGAASSVVSASGAAVKLCNRNPEILCPNNPKATCQQPTTGALCYPGDTDATAQTAAIKAAFADALGVIMTIANDKYLGSGMNETAKALNDITSELDKVPPGEQPCPAIVEAYCEIYNSAVELEKTVADVNAEIDKMENSEGMNMFKDNAGSMAGLHFLPWMMIIALSLYTCFWYCSYGTCCCCSASGGKCGPTLLLIPHTLLCLLFFVFTSIFIGISIIWKTMVLEAKLEDLQGDPTVGDVLDHIQTEFPVFWETVFADLEKGLLSYVGACWVLFIGVIITVIYMVCVCICRPYKPEEKAES